MKNIFLWSVAVLIIASTVVFGVFRLYQNDQILLSPVLGVSKISISDNLWFPVFSKQNSTQSSSITNLTAKAALFLDTQTGRVLFEKNSKERMPIASLVKIMAVIVTLESKDFNDVLSVSEHAVGMEPDKMLLLPYEKLTVEELLHGVFLVSANDAAEVLAEETTGLRDEFIKLMNLKAKQLGMEDTLFINPTGLEEDDPNFPKDSGQVLPQYSTAYDVSLMTRYAIRRWPHLLSISSKPHIYFPATSTHQDYDMYSGINLLTTYPGVIGFKTGYTTEAGLTLVTIVRRGDREVLGVILGATDRRDDARILLDYSFKQLGV